MMAKSGQTEKGKVIILANFKHPKGSSFQRGIYSCTINTSMGIYISLKRQQMKNIPMAKTLLRMHVVSSQVSNQRDILLVYLLLRLGSLEKP